MAYSKSSVNRAGRAWKDEIQALVSGEQSLDDIGPDLLEPTEIIEWWRSEHARPLSRVSANLRHYVESHGKPIVAQRLKRVPAMLNKLLREPTMKLSRMGDVGGVRAVLPNQEAAYEVARRLQRNWTITQFKDYVSEPKSDGYRALHLINRNRGRSIEVQLRTKRQDEWANFVETLSRKALPGLKFGAGPPALRQFLLELGDLSAENDQGLITDEDHLELFKSKAIELIKLLFETAK